MVSKEVPYVYFAHYQYSLRCVMQRYKPMSPEVRAALDALKEEWRAHRAKSAREERSKWRREWIGVGVQVLTLFVLAGTLGAIFFQAREMIRDYGPLQQQSLAAAQSAKAAISAAKDARQELIASNRPWIRVSVVRSTVPIRVAGGNLLIPVDFVLTNVGHSPAVNVNVDPRLYFYGSPAFIHPDNVLKQIVAEWKPLHRRSEIVLFPGDSIELPYVMSCPLDKVGWLFPGSRRAVAPAIVGTVAYYTRVDDQVHQTTFGVDVQRLNPTAADIAKKRSPDAIFLDEGPVPANNVRLVIDPMVGSYAD